MIARAMLRRSAMLVMCVTGTVSAAVAQEGSLPGRWEGAISVQGTEIPILVRFVDGDSLTATMDTQGATDVPLLDVTFENGRVHFTLEGSSGVALFDGQLEGNVIEGAFSQAGYTGTFELTRVAGRG